MAIEEFARVLRPGGRLLVSEGIEPWRGTNPDWLDSTVEMQWDVASAAETREQLQAGGFAVLEESTTAHRLDDEEERWTFFLARLEQ